MSRHISSQLFRQGTAFRPIVSTPCSILWPRRQGAAYFLLRALLMAAALAAALTPGPALAAGFALMQQGTAAMGQGNAFVAELDPARLSPPEDLVVREALFEEILKGRRDFFEREGRCRRKDGGFIWVWVHVSPIRDSSGKILFALVMFKDITQEKQVQAEINAYQQRLRSLASELSLTEERERRRLAADLHDHIG